MVDSIGWYWCSFVSLGVVVWWWLLVGLVLGFGDRFVICWRICCCGFCWVVVVVVSLGWVCWNVGVFGIGSSLVWFVSVVVFGCCWGVFRWSGRFFLLVGNLFVLCCVVWIGCCLVVFGIGLVVGVLGVGLIYVWIMFFMMNLVVVWLVMINRLLMWLWENFGDVLGGV